MKSYWLRLFPEQPVALDDAMMIPTAALRGAVANILLSTCIPGHQHDLGPCNAQCRYWSMFGEGRALRIGAAYAGTGDETAPFLASTRTCSLVPGFKVTGGHGIFDVAIREALFEQASSDPQRVLAPFLLRCPTCNAELIPCEGLLTRQGEREFVMVGDIASPVTTHHTTLGRSRRQILARYEHTASLINRGIYYVARLDVLDRHEPLLREVLSGGLWIGGQRSRGRGKMRAELGPRSSEALPLAERIVRFNRTYRAEQRFYAAMYTARLIGDEGEWYFTLDFQSPTLAGYRNEPSSLPALATLPTVALVRSWSSAQPVGGWHLAAGLPRRTQLGVTGVLLYRVPAETSRAIVEDVLAYLETDGVGMGRERGYGMVTVCDPFHLEMDPL